MKTGALTMNHLSFPTHNVEEESRFFRDHLGAVTVFIDEASGSILMKHGDIDIVLEKMKEEVSWHREFHFGFELETKREVEVFYQQFKVAGVHLDTEIFNRIGRGSRFFARTPGGVQFEVNTREDMDPKFVAPRT